MSLRNVLTDKFLLPLSDKVLGRDIAKSFLFLQESQFWSIDRLEQFQNRQLRKIIRFAYENVTYYTDLFDKLKLKPSDIRSKADLPKLPILTKEDIRNNFPHRIVDKHLKRGSYYKAASSGSTGEPLQYYISKKANSMNVAAGLRGWYSMGYKLGDKYVKISQNIRSTNEKKVQDILINSRYETLLQIDMANITRVLLNLKQFNPAVIRCYPDPLHFMAEVALDQDIIIRPKAIATTGNILHQESRKLIQKAFQCELFDAYSCEGSATYFECSSHSCYHSAMEYGISEFVDIHTTGNGKMQGRLISTDLWNYALPFIRYDSQDILEWDNNKCSCGKEHQNVTRIIGRDNDILITPDGKRLIVHIFTIYFSGVESVVQFQAVQDAINRITIKIVVNEKFNRTEEQKILTYWKEYIGDQVDVNLEVVDKIKPASSGKRRFLIRNKDVVLNNFV